MSRTHRLIMIVVLLLIGGALADGSALADTGSISGTVWQDANGDGVRQPDEPGIDRESVVLVQNGVELRSVQTDAAGLYRFDGVEVGSYAVRIGVSGLRLVETSPTFSVDSPFQRPVIVGLAPATDIDFGLNELKDAPGFIGLAFVNGAPANSPSVRAFIGGVDCTGPIGILPTDQDPATYGISVLPASVKADCGVPGATISFSVNGQRANETAVWQPVLAGQGLLQGRGQVGLTVGPPFAYFWPRVDALDADGVPILDGAEVVVALIDGEACGVGRANVPGGMLIIPSDELQPGCGEPGKVVQLAVNGLLAPETIVWQPGHLTDPDLHITLSQNVPAAGPAFAYYNVTVPPLSADDPGDESRLITAFIGDAFCGGAAGRSRMTVTIAVAPQELVPGCGYKDAEIVFSTSGGPGISARWQPGWHETDTISPPGTPPAEFAVTPTPAPGVRISPPNAGDAGLAAGR